MNEIQRKIEVLVAPILESMGAFLIEIHIGFGEKRKNVQLFVDSDTGITINACAEISRKLGSILELNNVFEGPYVLQVSSPGITKPLKFLRQYTKHVGRKLRVRYYDGSEPKEVKGVLEKIENDKLIVSSVGSESQIIEFSSIIESHVELPW